VRGGNRRPGGRSVFATARTTSDACTMRANRSARIASQRTTQHGRNALTCGNITNSHPRAPVITAQVLLLICGFGVQVPGGAPRLTWPFALSGPRAWGDLRAQIGQMRAESERGSHALNPPRRNLRARGHAPVRDRRDGTAQRTTDRLSTADFSDLFAGYRGAIDPGSGAIADALNTRPKYVASNTITGPRWACPTILSGDVAAAIGAAVRNRRPGPKDVASECRPLLCPGQWPGASVHVAVPCSKTPGAVAPNQLASKRSQPAYQKVVGNPKAVSDRRGDGS
jgi:hypothetical protein